MAYCDGHCTCGKEFHLKLIKNIRRYEGMRKLPYLDSATPPRITIGIGRNLTDTGISEDEAMFLLLNDLKKAKRFLHTFSWFANLNDDRKIIVINMVINLGLKGFTTFKHMLSALSKGDYRSAADEMEDSLWAKQVGYRAKELAEGMRNGKLVERKTG